MNKLTTITNASVFTGEGFLHDHEVVLEHNKIIAVRPASVEPAGQRIDAGGKMVLPGFIDLQIYGSGGDLFSAFPTAETLRQMDADLYAKGTVAFLACVATNTDEVVDQAIAAAKAYRQEAKGFLGLHLEGPYLNAKRAGAHVPEFIRPASLDEVKRLLEMADGVIKMMTIAPELQDEAVIGYLLEQGIVLSLGHSDATFMQATRAYNMGIATTTHLFNAMSPIHHRAPGIPTAVFNHPKAKASIIADGNHVDFEVIKFASRMMGDRLFLITDAVTACNTGPYQHILKGDKFDADGILSGSNITMLQAVANCVRHCGISPEQAIRMATVIPAELIGISGWKGKIAEGYDGDLLLVDENFKLAKS